MCMRIKNHEISSLFLLYSSIFWRFKKRIPLRFFSSLRKLSANKKIRPKLEDAKLIFSILRVTKSYGGGNMERSSWSRHFFWQKAATKGTLKHQYQQQKCPSSIQQRFSAKFPAWFPEFCYLAKIAATDTTKNQTTISHWLLVGFFGLLTAASFSQQLLFLLFVFVLAAFSSKDLAWSYGASCIPS